MTDAQAPYRKAFTEHLGEPLSIETAEELRSYFSTRRTGHGDRDERYFDAHLGFARPRFQVLYQAWQERGDRVLDAATSPVLRDALARGTGGLEFHVLPHPYMHLLPLVGTA